MHKWIFLSGVSLTSLFMFASMIPTGKAWYIPLLGTVASMWALYICQKHLPEGFWEEDFQDNDVSWEEEGF